MAGRSYSRSWQRARRAACCHLELDPKIMDETIDAPAGTQLRVGKIGTQVATDDMGYAGEHDFPDPTKPHPSRTRDLRTEVSTVTCRAGDHGQPQSLSKILQAMAPRDSTTAPEENHSGCRNFRYLDEFPRLHGHRISNADLKTCHRRCSASSGDRDAIAADAGICAIPSPMTGPDQNGSAQWDQKVEGAEMALQGLVISDDRIDHRAGGSTEVPPPLPPRP